MGQSYYCSSRQPDLGKTGRTPRGIIQVRTKRFFSSCSTGLSRLKTRVQASSSSTSCHMWSRAKPQRSWSASPNRHLLHPRSDPVAICFLLPLLLFSLPSPSASLFCLSFHCLLWPVERSKVVDKSQICLDSNPSSTAWLWVGSS